VRGTAVEGGITPPVAADHEPLVLDDSRDAGPPAPRASFVLAAFTLVAVVLTFPNLTRFRTFVAGDSGDSLLNLWILRTVQRGVPDGWSALWNAPIFVPAHDTLAYSETLFPEALVHWPLRAIVGDVAAFNLVALSAWVLSSWCLYRLALRMTGNWLPAFVAALAYTYAGIRLVHHTHFQLVVGGALVPLVVLLLLRCLDAPSPKRGLALGFAFAALVLTASYYGAMTGVVVLVVVVGYLAIVRPAPLGTHLRALGVAGVVVAVTVVPFGFEYLQLQRDSAFRRDVEPAGAAHVGDFLASADGYLLEHVPVISDRSDSARRGVENRLFPGFVAVGLGIAGVVVIARECRGGGWRRGRTREILLLMCAGAVCVLLAFGDRTTIAGHELPMPYALLRDHVPGFAGIRATARLALGGQLALVLLAAVGLDALLRRLRSRAQTLVALTLALVVLAESAMALTFVRVPTAADDGEIADALRARPGGVVLELPIRSSADGVAWPFVETPRQLASLEDGRPRVNGYSGFQPEGFDDEAAALNHFPAADALRAARRHGVRYVVLRTRLVGELTPSVLEPQLDEDGVGRYRDETARNIIAELPPEEVVRVERRPGGYLIELAR
jgi:hypothetical protein